MYMKGLFTLVRQADLLTNMVLLWCIFAHSPKFLLSVVYYQCFHCCTARYTLQYFYATWYKQYLHIPSFLYPAFLS